MKGNDDTMNKTEIVNAIYEIYELKTIGTDFDMNKLFTAVNNYDYYVRPGKQREMFMERYGTVLCKKAENEMNYLDWLNQIVGMIHLVKTTFDKEYFEAQIAVFETPVNREFIKNHLNSLTRKQLEKFITFVIEGRRNYGLFISNASSVDMWTELNERCVRKDSSIPRLDRVDYGNLRPKNPMYYFDYLSKQVIVDIFCNHIDKDSDLIESTVAAFCKSGISGLQKCVIDELQRRQLVGAAKDILKASECVS